MDRSAVCVFVGALVGAAATYGIMKNKDKIVEKFGELEGKLENTLKEKGMTGEKAKEVYQKVSESVNSSVIKLKELLHSKQMADADREHILREIEELKARLDRLS